MQIDAYGNVVPTKTEGTNNNQQTLGVSGNRWKALYIGDKDSHGGGE
jgi:hypothetical protein